MRRLLISLAVAGLAGCARAPERAAKPAPRPVGNARYPNCADTAVLAIGGGPVYRPCSVDKPVYERADNPRPSFPRGPEVPPRGEVALEFVVDSAGQIEPGTVRVLRSTHPAFQQAVELVLPRLRFTPAERDGRKVRMQLDLSYPFVR